MNRLPVEKKVLNENQIVAERLRERFRRLFSRIPALEREEVNILRGLLKALLK